MCQKPAEFCVVDYSTVVPTPLCKCPACKHEEADHVCGEINNRMQTYRNMCVLKMQACQTNQEYRFIRPGACLGKTWCNINA